MQHYPEIERHFLASLPPDLAQKRILDFGCGKGAIGFLLRQQEGGLDAHLVGVDVHAPYLEFGRRFNIYDELLCGDLGALRLPTFDIVIASEVIAHVPRPDADALLDRLEALASERVIVITPNGPDLRDPIDGVQSEARISVWHVRDFRARGYEVKGIGNRVHKYGKANRLTYAVWHASTPLALRVPWIGSTLLAVKRRSG